MLCAVIVLREDVYLDIWRYLSWLTSGRDGLIHKLCVVTVLWNDVSLDI